jgi:hypothetical protein
MLPVPPEKISNKQVTDAFYLGHTLEHAALPGPGKAVPHPGRGCLRRAWQTVPQT